MLSPWRNILIRSFSREREACGRFAPGEGNLPLMGDVIRYYLTIPGWSTAEAATRLDCSKRYVLALVSKGNTNMPDLLSIRVYLSGMNV
jgi:hypothetical protein